MAANTASKKANRYGTLCERAAARKYSLRIEGVHTSWKDAEYQNGTPVEIKSASTHREDRAEGRFRIFEAYHRKLVRNDGWYCFVAYEPKSRTEVRILKMKMVKASKLNPNWWGDASGHRDSRQSKIKISEIFG